MASQTVRIMIVDDVNTDQDMYRYFDGYRKLDNYLGYQKALAATQIKSMLRALDRAKGQRRAHRISRLQSLAAAAYVLAAKLEAASHARLRTLYEEDFAMLRMAAKTRRNGRRTVRVED